MTSDEERYKEIADDFLEGINEGQLLPLITDIFNSHYTKFSVNLSELNGLEGFERHNGIFEQIDHYVTVLPEFSREEVCELLKDEWFDKHCNYYLRYSTDLRHDGPYTFVELVNKGYNGLLFSTLCEKYLPLP